MLRPPIHVWRGQQRHRLTEVNDAPGAAARGASGRQPGKDGEEAVVRRGSGALIAAASTLVGSGAQLLEQLLLAFRQPYRHVNLVRFARFRDRGLAAA
jgi:hypothetical protein